MHATQIGTAETSSAAAKPSSLATYTSPQSFNLTWQREMGSSAPPPQPTVQNPYAPKAPPEHFWSSWFKPKEPEKPKSVKEWISTTKQIPLESAATKQ